MNTLPPGHRGPTNPRDPSSSSRQSNRSGHGDIAPLFRREHVGPEPQFRLRPISPTIPAATTSRSSSSRPEERFPALPSLSVYHAPSATYMWQNFRASSQMTDRPMLYATYGSTSSPTSSDSEDSESSPNQAQSPAAYHAPQGGRSGATSALSPSFSRREPSVEILPSPLYHPKQDERNQSSPSPVSSASGRRKFFDIGMPSRQDYRFSSMGPTSSVTQLPVAPPLPMFPMASSSKAPQSTTLPMDPGLKSPSNAQPSEEPENSRAWEKFAMKIINAEGGVTYLCTHTEAREGPGPCNYESKKQLVKRHVETIHMGLKPFVCDICARAFPQKTSLDVHRNTHTGETPLDCKFNCGLSFKDPARRHRHYVERHGYKPKQHGKRKRYGPEPSA